MSLGSRLIGLRARLGTVKDRFDLATSTRAIFIPAIGAPVPMVPNPTAVTIDARRVGSWLSDAVQIIGDETVLTGVTRLYGRALIESSDILLDVVEFPEHYTGKLARVITVADSNNTTWSLVVRVIEEAYTLVKNEDDIKLTYALDTAVLAVAIL